MVAVKSTAWLRPASLAAADLAVEDRLGVGAGRAGCPPGSSPPGWRRPMASALLLVTKSSSPSVSRTAVGIVTRAVVWLQAACVAARKAIVVGRRRSRRRVDRPGRRGGRESLVVGDDERDRLAHPRWRRCATRSGRCRSTRRRSSRRRRRRCRARCRSSRRRRRCRSACTQLDGERRDGSRLAGGGPSSAAFSTTVHIVALPEPTPSTVAVTPASGPADEGAPRSEATEVIRPLPVPMAVLRSTWLVGRVQPVVDAGLVGPVGDDASTRRSAL